MSNIFSKKAASFAFLISFSLLLSPITLRAELNQAYQNCLCRCGCTAAGSNCNAVSCTFNTKDYNASPSCAEAENGPCKCEGFGCFRAQTVTSGKCYDACQVHLTSKACTALKENYGTVRKDYLEKINVHKDLSDFEYKLIANTNRNTAKLGIAFVIQNLSSSPAKSVTDVATGIITDIITKQLSGTTTDPIEVQRKMLAANRQLEAKRKLLRDEAKNKMAELKTIVEGMKKEKCSYEDKGQLPLLPEVKLSDVSNKTVREVKIKALSDLGIIKGYDDGTYKPEKKINRAEFIKILIASKFPEEVDKSKDNDPKKKNCFSDIASEWYSKYVCTAKEKGIIKGYGDGTFKPGQEINAAEALKIIMETVHPDKLVEVKGEWWRKYWNKAVEMGILVEDVKAADTKINRGQMAEMIYTAISEDIISGDFSTNKETTSTKTETTQTEKESNEEAKSTESSSEETKKEKKTELPNKFEKSEEYSFSYPDGWTLKEHNETHKSFYKDGNEISITESGYEYEKIKSLIEEAYLKFPKAKIKMTSEEPIDNSSNKIYVVLVEYEYDGKKMMSSKMVVPNEKGTHYIWEVTAASDDFENVYDIFEGILNTWDQVK